MRAFPSHRRPARILIIVAAAALCGCRNETAQQPGTSDGRLLIYVSIPPQKYLVERIGGKHVRAEVLLKPGQSPHTYEPTPRQMVDLSSAKVFFRIGAPFETQIADKIGQTLKSLLIVDINEGIPLRQQTEICLEHEGHEHEHSEIDMHTWMSPRLARIQAATVCRILSRVDPARQADYEANLGELQGELERLDTEIAESLEPLKGRAFLVFHPAFGYFADAYNLRQIAIEAGGKNGIIPADELTENFVRSKTDKPYTVLRSDPDAAYHSVREYDLARLEPTVAQPHSPDHRALAHDLREVKLTRAYIGSCTGGKIEDFEAAARVLDGKQVQIDTFVVPATTWVDQELDNRKVNGHSLREVFLAAGAKIGPASCAACLGGPADTFGRLNGPEVCISTTNRNFPGRMGSKAAQVFLASPLTVAASAIRGSITDPRDFIG